MRSLRVLCVEDRTSWLRVLQERLEESGYEVIPAESGTEGIRLFHHRARRWRVAGGGAVRPGQSRGERRNA